RTCTTQERRVRFTRGSYRGSPPLPAVQDSIWRRYSHLRKDPSRLSSTERIMTTLPLGPAFYSALRSCSRRSRYRTYSRNRAVVFVSRTTSTGASGYVLTFIKNIFETSNRLANS